MEEKKKRKGRTENLVPFDTVEKAREKGALGGIASGVAKRKRKDLRETALAFLEATGYSGDKRVDGYTAMIGALVEKALKGDVSAFTALRDTAGQKPVETLNLNDTRPKSIEIEFVDKSQPKKQATDPKIIGESSPTVGNDRK